MTYRVILLPRAERDIEANARWWAENHSVDQAIVPSLQSRRTWYTCSPFDVHPKMQFTRITSKGRRMPLCNEIQFCSGFRGR